MSENNENISIDEMMRNLKRGEVKKKAIDIDSGERVTRADGSEVIKVRTKKRRTVQPKQEAERKSLRSKIILISAVISLLLISIIAYSFLLGYYNGNRFKSDVSRSITSLTGANTELGALDVGTFSSSVSKVHLSWEDKGSLVREFTSSTIFADCGVFDLVADGVGVGGTTLDASEAELKLVMVDELSEYDTSTEFPFDYQFNLFQCSSFKIDFDDGENWGLQESSISYRVNEEDSGFLKGKISLDSGEFKVPLFGDFTVQNGLIEVGDMEAKVYMGLNSTEFNGQFNIDGTCGYTRNSSIDLVTTMRDYDLKGLLEPKARRFFHGRVSSGEGTFNMKMGDLESFEMSSDLVMRDVTITDFAFIRGLAQLMDDDFYTNPKFSDKLTMKLKRSNKVTEYSDIDLKQEAFMYVKGSLSIDELNLISGMLEVGLPVTVLSGRNAELLRSVFSYGDGEFIWVRVNISGDLLKPTDDFSQQIEQFSSKSDAKLFDELLEQ